MMGKLSDVLTRCFGIWPDEMEVCNVQTECLWGHSTKITIEGYAVIPKSCPKPARQRPPMSLTAKKVVFNYPATVVMWEDGTKTVVKCNNKDRYDPILGIALCYMKKALGNNSRNFNDELHKHGM